MTVKDAPTTRSVRPAITPTRCLTQSDHELDLLGIYELAKTGFTLESVQAMVSSSDLYASMHVLKRIMRRPSAKRQRGAHGAAARLSSEQSAVAYQFAKVLEHATSTFGSQHRAEEWLSRPCRYLADHVPLDLVDDALGFLAVESYLERVELGVYQ